MYKHYNCFGWLMRLRLVQIPLMCGIISIRYIQDFFDIFHIMEGNADAKRGAGGQYAGWLVIADFEKFETSCRPTRRTKMSFENDCLSCRVIGGSAFVGVGSYAIWSSRPKAVGSPIGKRLVGLMGLGTFYSNACLRSTNAIKRVSFCWHQ